MRDEFEDDDYLRHGSKIFNIDAPSFDPNHQVEEAKGIDKDNEFINQLYDSVESQGDGFYPEHSECSCCNGFCYSCKGCIDTDMTCKCITNQQQDQWFPKAKDCLCCQGYMYNCRGLCKTGSDVCDCMFYNPIEDPQSPDEIPLTSDLNINAPDFQPDSGEGKENEELANQLYRSIERSGDGYYPQHSDCSCCKGFVYSCKGSFECSERLCCVCMSDSVDFDPDNWFPDKRDCICCGGYIYKCQKLCSSETMSCSCFNMKK